MAHGESYQQRIQKLILPSILKEGLATALTWKAEKKICSLIWKNVSFDR